MGKLETLPFINSSGLSEGLSARQKRIVRSQAAKQVSPADAVSPLSSQDWKNKRRRRAPPFTVTLELSKQSILVESQAPKSSNEGSLDSAEGSEESVKTQGIPSNISTPLSCSGSLMSETTTKLFFDHYLTRLALHVPELDLTPTTCVLQELWFPMALTQTCTTHIIALTSASHYASFVSDDGSHAVQLLSMKQEALSILQAALRDNVMNLSDTTIAAVAKFASYEAMFGSTERFDMHMTGLKTMIQLRGGLQGLGLQGLLARMVVWIDRNSAFLIGGNRKVYFSREDDDNFDFSSISQANPSHFLGAF